MSGGETADQARTRRRWITLAEAVALAGVLIAGLTLYLSWSDKQEDRAERAAAAQAQSRAATVVTLRATRAKDGARLDLADAQHPVDAIDVAFPAALGVAARDALVQPRIEADWFDDALLKLAKGDDARGRLPVLVTTTHWDGDAKRVGRALYDVAWHADGGLFGRSLKLDGIMLRARGGTPAGLEAAWRQLAPPPAKAD